MIGRKTVKKNMLTQTNSDPFKTIGDSVALIDSLMDGEKSGKTGDFGSIDAIKEALTLITKPRALKELIEAGYTHFWVLFDLHPIKTYQYCFFPHRRDGETPSMMMMYDESTRKQEDFFWKNYQHCRAIPIIKPIGKPPT